MKRMAVDVGGTFTDCLVLSEDGSLETFKSPTDTTHPEDGVIRCLDLAADRYGMTTEELVSAVEVMVHGTTLALNTLVTGSGARVGMITTEGFRDIIEIRRGLRDQRVSLYDVFIPPYEPLAPRYLRLGVPERALYSGEVQTPLDEDATRAVAESLRSEGVESVAVCFLHSYADSGNENRAAAIAEEVLGPGTATTSHEVLPVWREFERFSTTVVSAYVGPVVGAYISNLQARLTDLGLGGALLMMLANGLVQTVEEVKGRAVNLLSSGPSAAPYAAVHSASDSVGDDLISVDMGGTSFDVCVIDGGSIPSTTERWVEDHRVAIKMVDVHSIGAGGGSIASVDPLGLLRVGPESAGADPGPACYGRGGERPTVTDANLVLGFIPDTLAAGGLSLDVESGRAALEGLGEELNLTPEEAAQAVYDTVTSTMANKIMEVCTRQGHDVRDFSLVVGGGAGPLHGASLAEQLEIQRVFVPAAAGLYSAFGMLTMGIGRDLVRSYPVRADRAEAGVVQSLYAEMELEAREAFERMGVSEEDLSLVRSAEVRYERQFHEVETPVPSGPVDAGTLEQLVESFHREHEAQYGFSSPTTAVEFLVFRLRATAPTPSIDVKPIPEGGRDPSEAIADRRPCYWKGELAETPIYSAARLRSGNRIGGPAVILADTTTLALPAGFECVTDGVGNYILERRGSNRE